MVFIVSTILIANGKKSNYHYSYSFFNLQSFFSSLFLAKTNEQFDKGVGVG